MTMFGPGTVNVKRTQVKSWFC